jgi:APA family basic amino acid/polyamine antiporter
MPKDDLVRQMGLFDSTMMMVGIVIGSGIFLTTGIMALSLPSSGLILLAWIFGGLIVLCGALTYAELGAAMPEAGGIVPGFHVRGYCGPGRGFRRILRFLFPVIIQSKYYFFYPVKYF